MASLYPPAQVKGPGPDWGHTSGFEAHPWKIVSDDPFLGTRVRPLPPPPLPWGKMRVLSSVNTELWVLPAAPI